MIDICIVGNGRSVEGSGWGARIDGCHRVVRMAGNTWQTASDWGERTDHAFVHPVGRYRDLVEQTKPPAMSWFAQGRLKNAQGVLVETIPADWLDEWVGFAQRRSRIDKLKLSRGTIAACFAAVKYWPCRIVLAGFDAVRSGRVSDLEYPEAFTYQHRVLREHGSSTTLGPHDFEHEMAVIEAVSEYTTCADEIWDRA